MYKGFYHNTTLEQQYDHKECLGDESYEALDFIAEAIEDLQEEKYVRALMGVTALFHVVEDNRANCKFEEILLDVTTLCFVNDCGTFKIVSNFTQNWAEACYALSMVLTTLISFLFDEDGSLESKYIFWYRIGDSMALFIDDLLSYRS